MEKIVIFVIIMIISSYFSKKKKQAQVSRHESSTTFYDSNGNIISKPHTSSKQQHSYPSKTVKSNTQQPQNMSEALNELKNIFTNTTQQKPVHKPTSVFENSDTVYEVHNHPVSIEDNNSEYSENKYQQVESNYDTYMQKNKTDRINKENSAFNPPIKEKNSSYTIKAKSVTHKKDILSNLFDSRNNLKKAVIITEVFNKKY
ncbi:MAG: hypothetical protein JXR69_03935 [Candidatus Delongbacteria bacterium]|nr:hypothetical protein [Candidatus Delongbacteria bacterium]